MAEAGMSTGICDELLESSIVIIVSLSPSLVASKQCTLETRASPFRASPELGDMRERANVAEATVLVLGARHVSRTVVNKVSAIAADKSRRESTDVRIELAIVVGFFKTLYMVVVDNDWLRESPLFSPKTCQVRERSGKFEKRSKWRIRLKMSLQLVAAISPAPCSTWNQSS